VPAATGKVIARAAAKPTALLFSKPAALARARLDVMQGEPRDGNERKVRQDVVDLSTVTERVAAGLRRLTQ
jgi:hypothetical protein